MTKAEFLAILERNLNGTATDAERKIVDRFFRDQLTGVDHEWSFTESERIRIEVLKSLNRAIDEESSQSIHERRSPLWRIALAAVLIMATSFGVYLKWMVEDEIHYTTIATQRGEQRSVTLADGSVVYLNAESSVTFPASFKATETREVELSGEGFFEVVRDEERPFVVRSAGLLTTVLGTSFNISAYSENEDVSVTVATGKVRIQITGETGEETGETLTAGQQGLYNKPSETIVTTAVNVERYLAWKEGTIHLEGASLKEATDILGRWYDAEFEFRNQKLKDCTIDGKFRNDQLENILENLRFLIGFEYRIEPGNRIIIDGKSCN